MPTVKLIHIPRISVLLSINMRRVHHARLKITGVFGAYWHHKYNVRKTPN